MVTLRPYRPDDLEALYSICLLTGAAGQDASPLHNDLQLVGHIYAAPYGVLEPGNVFVAEDEEGVAGYVVGTHDSQQFSDRQETEWWPALRERYDGAENMSATDRERISTIMRPQRALPELVGPYPAHIHMNLLPRLRGQRIGTRLLEMWIDQARTAGVKGIHLGASAGNAGGIAFWSRSGFSILSHDDGAVWLGMSL
jgi:GNAT superfamily N-acetyltransferase